MDLVELTDDIRLGIRLVRRGAWLAIALLALVQMSLAQATPETTAQVQTTNPAANPPLALTLQDALEGARKNNPEYRASVTEAAIAREERVQGRAALLPSVGYNAGFLYTEGGGLRGVGRYVGNNGVHEYVSQGDVHQLLSLESVADYRRALAAEDAAKARAEIAARGLVVTVVEAYYGLLAAQGKYSTAQRAATEAQHFLDISQKRESGGEAAHSDVIKAEIQAQQQERELQEAELEMNRGRLELAVLVFPDLNQNFNAVDDLQAPEALPGFSDVQAAAARNNPDLRAAVASLEAAHQEVAVAWNGFLPSLSLDYFYGIDANQFATRDPQGLRNLGYAATATLQLPVWNWGANRSRLKQADLRREQARVELSFTQRQLLAKLHNLYREAETSHSALESLTSSAELAAESLRLTTLRYQAGEATVLEVVDAQNTVTQARNALNDGQVRYRVALANLETLTGVF